jgi:tetratricopeptide (TPR) repeat protein
LLAALRRFEEAEREVLIAQRQEPLSALAAYLSGGVATLSGRPEEGERRCLMGLEFGAQHPMLHLWLGVSREMQGRMPEAIQSFEAAARLMDDAPMALGSLGYALALSGRRDEAQVLLERMMTNRPEGYYIAMVYHGLGDDERALEWLERASMERGTSTIVMMAAADPRLETLRQTPRYRAVLDRIGLP